MTKIIQLTAENVKRLTAVTITPQGNVVVIAGDNAAGKTSVLDSIAMAFGGGDEIPVMPVRKGQKNAKIIAELDNGLIIKRTFTAAGGTALVVENKDGARYPSPQAMLDALTGKLMFDPLAFTRLDATKQAAALRKLVGIDFSAQDGSRKALYDERTLVNRTVAQVSARVEQMPFHKDAPAFEVSTADVMAELEAAQKHNATKHDLTAKISAKASSLKDQRQKTAMIRREILDLEERLRQTREMLAPQEAMEKAVAAEHDAAIAADFDFKPTDEVPIRDKLAGAAVTNKQVHENTLREDAITALKGHQAKAEDLTLKIEAIDKNKESVLSSAKFPIAGLSFDENGVTYQGIPFAQASGAQQLRISVAMSAALNPKLRVMIVRDGSLLDAKSMTLLAELAAEHNLQVFVERVGKDDACSIIIENGEVAGKAEAPAENVLSHDAHAQPETAKPNEFTLA